MISPRSPRAPLPSLAAKRRRSGAGGVVFGNSSRSAARGCCADQRHVDLLKRAFCCSQQRISAFSCICVSNIRRAVISQRSPRAPFLPPPRSGVDRGRGGLSFSATNPHAWQPGENLFMLFIRTSVPMMEKYITNLCHFPHFQAVPLVLYLSAYDTEKPHPKKAPWNVPPFQGASQIWR